MLCPTPFRGPELALLGETESQLHKITKQATWLKKTTCSLGSFFHLFHFDCFGSWGPWLQSALQILGISLLIIITIPSLVCCVLSKALNACSQSLTTQQMISLLGSVRKGTKGWLAWRMYLKWYYCRYHRDETKTSCMTCGYHTKEQKLRELHKAVDESGAEDSNFDCIFWLSWESDQKWGIVKKKTETPKMTSLKLRVQASKPIPNQTAVSAPQECNL